MNNPLPLPLPKDLLHSTPPLRILALETSTRQGSIALFSEGELFYEPTDPDCGRYLVSHLQTFLTQHQTPLSTLNLLVLDAGPGSYTGLRIGFAIAKTFAWYHQIPLCTVESTQVLASNYQGSATEIAIALDARQNEFYFATYQRPSEHPHPPYWEPLTPLQLVSHLHTHLPCLGDVTPPVDPHASGLPPRADHLLLLGYHHWKKGKTISDLFALEPLYLRPSYAEQKKKTSL